MTRVGLNVEFQGGDKGQQESEEKLECEEHVGVGRQVAVAVGLAKGMLAVCDRNRTRCCCCWWREAVPLVGSRSARWELQLLMDALDLQDFQLHMRQRETNVHFTYASRTLDQLATDADQCPQRVKISLVLRLVLRYP